MPHDDKHTVTLGAGPGTLQAEHNALALPCRSVFGSTDGCQPPEGPVLLLEHTEQKPVHGSPPGPASFPSLPMPAGKRTREEASSPALSPTDS